MKKEENNKKLLKSAILAILVITILSLTLSGCGKKDTSEDTEASTEEQEEQTQDQTQTTEQQQQEEQPVQETGTQDTPLENLSADITDANLTNETADITQQSTKSQSGSLELQNSFDACSHLSQVFECDHQDLADCNYQIILGKEGFFPTQIKCRYGKEPGETPTRKYCYSLECRRNTDEGNIVISYGGIITFGEYRYSVRKEGTGVITHYELSRCGETTKTFPTMDACNRYLGSLT
jgi:hypothetical protein